MVNDKCLLKANVKEMIQTAEMPGELQQTPAIYYQMIMSKYNLAKSDKTE
ncbi:MAG: hypothetical protein NC308_08845 [Clostridium sp.]|nr:hypothetical protein [Bacteroides sp.]MCM1198984.1 hypothetical protein [Clostridium sp.]